MTLGDGRSPAELVKEAIERFSAGDDDGFVNCFAPDAVVWAESQLAPTAVLSGREQIAAWCREARSRWSHVRFSHGELTDCGPGAYVELNVMTDTRCGGGAWRLPIAVFVADGLVTEAVPQPDQESALARLSRRS
jgi:ketosteroid isomerase-like protein